MDNPNLWHTHDYLRGKVTALEQINKMLVEHIKETASVDQLERIHASLSSLGGNIWSTDEVFGASEIGTGFLECLFEYASKFKES